MNHIKRQRTLCAQPAAAVAASHLDARQTARTAEPMAGWRRLAVHTLACTSLALLAACQTTTGGASRDVAAVDPATVTPAAPAAPAPQASPAGAPRQAAMLAVYLADTERQEGWAEVKVGDGMLYVRQEPIVTREHLVRIQAGRNQEGAGLLALDLSEEGQQRVLRDTTDTQNKRLALVVDNTMLAAPTFSGPVRTGRLIFPVGSEQNAAAAARAVAGAAPGDAEPAAAGAAR